LCRVDSSDVNTISLHDIILTEVPDVSYNKGRKLVGMAVI